MFSIRKAALSAALGLSLIGGVLSGGSAHAAEPPSIRIYYQGEELAFSDTGPVIRDGTTLVPFRKLFETLGFTVRWVEAGGSRIAIGIKGDLVIQLTIDSPSAQVNDATVPLSVPAQIIGGSTMVPLRFVAENSGYEVSYEAQGGSLTIRIGSSGVAGGAGGVQTPADAGKIEPYVVKGYVRDEAGNPLEGAEILADNTFAYNSNILGVTDSNGFYRLELPQAATTWQMSGNYTQKTNGQTYRFDLTPDIDRPFAGNTGAIRDFTWINAAGYLFIYFDVFSYKDGMPMYRIEDLEVTLTPIGPSIDGSTKQPIVKRGGPVYDGMGVDQIPIGKYKATARWLPEGIDPVPVNIRLRNTGKYAPSVDFEFKTPRGTTLESFLVELEVSLP